MIRIVFVGVMVIILSAFAVGQNYAYVVNGMAETLSRIDLETGQVDNHIIILGVVPNQVVHYDGMLYVVNSLSPSLMVIDPAANNIISEIAMPINSNSWNAALSNGYAYITGLAVNSVYKVDVSAETIVDTWETGQSPEGVLVDGERLYVTNTAFNPVDFSYGQGSVTILDINSGDELSRINVGKNPQNVMAGPDGLVNVICTGDYASHFGMVYFIDPWDMMVVDSLALGGTQTVPVINSSGIVLVAAGGWADHGYIYSYDAYTRTVLRDWDNPILVNKGAMGLAIDAMGLIYCACQMDNVVDKLTVDGSAEGSYNVGSGPVSIAILDTRTSIDEIAETPDKYSLKAPYPNPFNSSVVIPYESKSGNTVTIEIFDIGGRLVKLLSSGSDHSIYNSVIWNGLDSRGQEVVSGVYFARLRGTSETEKMVLLR